jgi:predicted PurR-regulated permease PerM
VILKIIKKFLSRKFILTLISSAFSVAFALSGLGGSVGTICSIVAAFSAPIIYVITEGKIDSAALSMLSESAQKASEIVKNKETD